MDASQLATAAGLTRRHITNNGGNDSMSILTDIRTAVAGYANTNVTTTISTPVPDVPGTVNPDEEFSFNITATNAGAPDGIALINVRYHLSVSGAGVQLIVPAETLAIARAGATDSFAQLTPGALVGSMSLFPVSLDGQSLGIGDSDALNGLKGKAGSGTGVGTLSVHAHVDPDVDALFPKERLNLSGTRSVNVV